MFFGTRINQFFSLYLFVLIILLMLVQTGYSQTPFKSENLGPIVNSEYAEINPVVAEDGRTVFFTMVNHPENRFGEIDSQDIWYAIFQEDSTWTEPQRLPDNVNVARYNAILAALDDGKSYLIYGRYNRSGTRWLTRGFSIVEQISETEWGIPQPLRIRRFSRFNRAGVFSAHMSANRNLLFISSSRNARSERLSLYVSKKTEPYHYAKPAPVTFQNTNIRRFHSIEAPFITRDNSRLYFTANLESNRNEFNIYFAERLDATYTNWSEPVRATDEINSPNWESYFRMNRDESWAYFSSVTNSYGKADLFRIKMYEEFPYLRLRGSIANQHDESLMLEDTAYTILVNGREFEGMNIDRKNASYEVLLPLGASYTLLPVMENWNGVSLTMDLTHVLEYTESRRNLYFTEIPVFLVQGRIIDTRTNEPISLNNNPKVKIDGAVSDSVVFDQFSASYQVVLNLGATYSFAAQVDNFTAKVEVVDVSDVNEFFEKKLDLYVTSVPWVQVRGQLLDINSMRPITGELNPTLVINGSMADSVYIDPVDGSYAVKLSFGARYNLEVLADQYISLENILDLTPFEEYAEIRQNVFAGHRDANMAFVSGQIINTKTNRPIDPEYEFTMLVNGVELPSFRYDNASATYSINLITGWSYDVLSSVPNFYNRQEQIDLTEVSPMTELKRDIYVTPIEVGAEVDIEHIYFEFGHARLEDNSYRSLRAIVDFLEEYSNVRIEIGGHTDNIGSAAVNQRVSEDRANAVRDYILSQGIPQERVVSRGYGLTRPKVSNRTAEGRAQNRRVAFTIIGI